MESPREPGMCKPYLPKELLDQLGREEKRDCLQSPGQPPEIIHRSFNRLIWFCQVEEKWRYQVSLQVMLRKEWAAHVSRPGVSATQGQRLGSNWEIGGPDRTKNALMKNLDFTLCAMRKPREPISRGRLHSDLYFNKSIPVAGWRMFWNEEKLGQLQKHFQNGINRTGVQQSEEGKEVSEKTATLQLEDSHPRQKLVRKSEAETVLCHAQVI